MSSIVVPVSKKRKNDEEENDSNKAKAVVKGITQSETDSRDRLIDTKMNDILTKYTPKAQEIIKANSIENKKRRRTTPPASVGMQILKKETIMLNRKSLNIPDLIVNNVENGVITSLKNPFNTIRSSQTYKADITKDNCDNLLFYRIRSNFFPGPDPLNNMCDCDNRMIYSIQLIMTLENDIPDLNKEFLKMRYNNYENLMYCIARMASLIDKGVLQAYLSASIFDAPSSDIMVGKFDYRYFPVNANIKKTGVFYVDGMISFDSMMAKIQKAANANKLTNIDMKDIFNYVNDSFEKKRMYDSFTHLTDDINASDVYSAIEQISNPSGKMSISNVELPRSHVLSLNYCKVLFSLSIGTRNAEQLNQAMGKGLKRRNYIMGKLRQIVRVLSSAEIPILATIGNAMEKMMKDEGKVVLEEEARLTMLMQKISKIYNIFDMVLPTCVILLIKNKGQQTGDFEPYLIPEDVMVWNMTEQVYQADTLLDNKTYKMEVYYNKVNYSIYHRMVSLKSMDSTIKKMKKGDFIEKLGNMKKFDELAGDYAYFFPTIPIMLKLKGGSSRVSSKPSLSEAINGKSTSTTDWIKKHKVIHESKDLDAKTTDDLFSLAETFVNTNSQNMNI